MPDTTKTTKTDTTKKPKPYLSPYGGIFNRHPTGCKCGNCDGNGKLIVGYWEASTGVATTWGS